MYTCTVRFDIGENKQRAIVYRNNLKTAHFVTSCAQKICSSRSHVRGKPQISNLRRTVPQNKQQITPFDETLSHNIITVSIITAAHFHASIKRRQTEPSGPKMDDGVLKAINATRTRSGANFLFSSRVNWFTGMLRRPRACSNLLLLFVVR